MKRILLLVCFSIQLFIAKAEEGMLIPSLIEAFEDGEYDILVGTQMVTKGLDFTNVSLVGVLNADSLLFYPDFRAMERAYQLLLQVSGRAGRREKRGNVLIQIGNVHHVIA